MSERKWIETVREREHGAYTIVRAVHPDGIGRSWCFLAPNACLRDAPDDEQLRRERDVAREAADVLQRERDEARREAEELRAENERLRERLRTLVKSAREASSIGALLEGNPAWNDAVEPVADQPAPQTHYREGDVVLLNNGDTVTLEIPLRNTACPGEVWEPNTCDEVYIHPDRNPVLERDGTPTDAGLRRLAEKAGYRFTHIEEPAAGTSGYSLDDGIPHSRSATATLYGESDKYRRRLADALREMGGA